VVVADDDCQLLVVQLARQGATSAVHDRLVVRLVRQGATSAVHDRLVVQLVADTRHRQRLPSSCTRRVSGYRNAIGRVRPSDGVA